jgi:predicted alpha/beta-fold hydrolase
LIYLNIRKKINAKYSYDRIEQLTMADGGTTALAWCGDHLPADTPTIVVLHTITGSPGSMQEMVSDLHEYTGWRVVLCLRRGHGDLPLKTPKINILGSTSDLIEQLQYIQHQLPNSTLYSIGSSAGSGLLVRYLGELKQHAAFQAAFAYCPGYDTESGFAKVHPTYSKIMGRKLVKQFVHKHAKQLQHLKTLPKLQQVESISDFHDHQYELAGYDDQAAYLAATNPMLVFDQVSVPLMVLNAEDDPICHIDNVKPYLPMIQKMPNVILVTTEQGSHCAHYEGWKARSWAHRLMANYFLAIQALKA